MTNDDDILQVAHIVPATEAEGPGTRFALWFQGCPLRCPGCCNPEMLPFEGGAPQRLADIIDAMRVALRDGIEGITLLGGEPFAHAAVASRLADAAHDLDLSVMAFTGYLLEELTASADPAVHRLLERIDILVDGPYVRELPETTRRWIGSSNQRVHFLGNRCSADDPRWQAPNTLEVRLEAGVVTVNGFPATQAVGLWRRLRS